MSTQLKGGPPPRVTTRTIVDMKARGEKIAMLTAYDFTMSRILDSAGIDILLVGDSAGNVMMGHETTLPVTMDQMVFMTSTVVRGAARCLVVADLPFMAYQVTAEEALRNAGRLMQEAGAHAVKLEGGSTVAHTVRKIVDAGIPVMGHLGLTPQSIYKFGTYKVRATDPDEAGQLIADARLLQEAGCFAVVLEKIPQALAAQVTAALSIPTIGIGAGPACDGQVLVMHDMLGLTKDFKPRFIRRYLELHESIGSAVGRYVADVRSGGFPSAEESYDR